MGKSMHRVISYDRMPLVANPGFVLNPKENNPSLLLNMKVTIPISRPNSDNIFDGFFRHDQGWGSLNLAFLQGKEALRF